MTDTDRKEQITEYPKKGESGQSSISGYSVEARLDSREPKEIGGQIFDNRWRKVWYTKSPIGIPISSMHKRILEESHLYNYTAAQALRWWLHAVADAEQMMGGLCLQTKLVQHKIKTGFSCEAVSEHKIIGGDDRSSHIPDWGKSND